MYDACNAGTLFAWLGDFIIPKHEGTSLIYKPTESKNFSASRGRKKDASPKLLCQVTPVMVRRSSQHGELDAQKGSKRRKIDECQNAKWVVRVKRDHSQSIESYADQSQRKEKTEQGKKKKKSCLPAPLNMFDSKVPHRLNLTPS